MGEATEPDDEHAPEDADEEEHHGPTIGVAVGLNVIINAAINAAFGYGIAWLHWQDYTLSWYTHELHGLFETDFIREDVIFQGISVAVIVTLIVAAILHRQWDGDHLQPGRMDGFLLDGERSRGKHLLTWTGAMAVMGLLVSVLVTAVTVTGVEEGVTGSTFALARTVNGFVVGGLAGGLVTASWITNLTAGNLVPSRPGESLVARTMARSSEHAWIVLGAVLLLTAGLGIGVAELNVDVNETDAMPRGTHHHEAALAVAEDFNGTHTSGFQVHFRTDEAACIEDNRRNLPAREPGDTDCANISDEVYIRAMDEFFTFVEDYSYQPEESFFTEEEDGDDEDEDDDSDDEPVTIESPVESQLGLPTYHRLANWSLSGGQQAADEEAYALPAPDDRARVNAAENHAWDRLADAQMATIGEDASQARVSYHVEADSGLTSRQLGAFALDARDAYLDRGDARTWSVFDEDNKPLVEADRPVANAHHARSLEDDMGTIWAIVGIGALVSLLVVFRDPLAAIVATATTAMAGAWTYGLMGHAEVPLSQLDLVQAPLILAGGLFLAVPTIETYLDRAEESEDAAEAFRRAGDEACFPWYVGILVAIVGLTVLGLGPSSLAADSAWVSLWGLTSVLLLTITFVPATLSLVAQDGRLVGGAEERAPDIGGAGWVSRSIAAGLVVALTMASLGGVAGLTAEANHEPADAWPEEDDLGKEHRQALLGFHDLGDDEERYVENLFVVQADVTEPETLTYTGTLSDELEAQATGSETLETRTSRNLSSVIRDWLEVCCGAQSLAGTPLSDALQQGGAGNQTSSYPTSEEEIQATLEDMFDSPYAPVVRPVVAGPDGDTIVQSVSVRAGDADAAERGWQAAVGVVDQTDALEPQGTETSFVGPTASSHLTSEDQMPWVLYLLVAGVLTAGVVGLGYGRSLRSGLVLTLVVGLASLWHLGLLSAMDVGFSPSTSLGAAVGLLAATGFGMGLIGAPVDAEGTKRARGPGRTGLFSMLVLVGLLGGVVAIADTSAGFPSLLVEDAVQSAVAAIGSAYLACVLVGRALVVAEDEAEQTEETEVVEATEAA